jgi:hypothetical protein
MAAIPLTPTASSSSETSFQAAMATLASRAVPRVSLARCARVTARTGPKLEIAACCASRSVILIAAAAAAVSRR